MVIPSRNDKISPSANAKGAFPELDFTPATPATPYDKSPVDDTNPKTKRVRLREDELIRDHGLSYFATLINFLKSLVGAGFLSLPLAFKASGLWTGFLLLVLFAFLNCFCMSQIVKCAQHHYKQLGISNINYGDMAWQTCANSFSWVQPFRGLAKQVVNAAILFLQFGFCSTYYLFIAVSLKEICDDLSSFRASTLQWLLLIFLPLVCLLNSLRTLRFIAFLSMLGNLLMSFSLIFILQFVIRNPKYSVSDLPWFNTFDGFLTAAGAIIYSFEAQTLVLPMENKLRRPGQMLGPFGVLSTGITLASLIYASIGFFGYVAYGDEVKGSITLNLPQHQVSFTLVKLAVCLSIFASFLLQMYVIVDMFWPRIVRMLNSRAGEQKHSLPEAANDGPAGPTSGERRTPVWLRLTVEVLFRTLLVSVCFIFAAAVPNLERIIPLVGITSGMLLAFVFPALLDLLTFGPILLAKGRRSIALVRIVRNFLLVCLGLFAMFNGLWANIREMTAAPSPISGLPTHIGNGTSLANDTSI